MINRYDTVATSKPAPSGPKPATATAPVAMGPQEAPDPSAQKVPSPPSIELVRSYLAPGQLFTSRAPAEVTTIVGSCVALCLFDGQRRAGGVSHFVLPSGPGERGARAGRFGDAAFDALVRELLSLGCSQSSLRATVFGGACMIDAFRDRGHHLGAQNVDMALALLRESRIPVLHQDTGGRRGRRVVFRTHDGASEAHLL